MRQTHEYSSRVGQINKVPCGECGSICKREPAGWFVCTKCGLIQNQNDRIKYERNQRRRAEEDARNSKKK